MRRSTCGRLLLSLSALGVLVASEASADEPVVAPTTDASQPPRVEAATPAATPPATSAPTPAPSSPPTIPAAATPPGEPPPPAKVKAAEPAPRPAERSTPDDVFLLDRDDPKVPSFLRALRAGRDSLLLGGWIRPGYTYVVDSDFNDDDADGFEFYDARLIGRGDMPIAGDFGASFRFNFDVNRGNFAVRDTYGTLWYDHDLVALDVGLLKTPLGLSLLQSQSSMQLPTNTIVRRLSFGRDLGAQLRTEFNLGPVWIHAAGMLSNGDAGFRQRRNLDDQLVVTGRLEVAPLGKMRREEADLDDSDFQLTLGFSAGHNGALTNDLGLQDSGAEETKLQGDVRAWFRGASLRAEYLRGMRGDNDAGPGFDRYGLVVQAGYVLPIPLDIPRLEVVGRFQQADVNTSLQGDEAADYLIDNTETRVVEIGANAYFARHAAKLQVMYQMTFLEEGQVPTGEDVPVGDALLTALQFGWL